MLEQKAVELLDKLAAEVGVASEKVWEWSLLQVQVDIYRAIGVVLFAIAASYVYYKILRHIVSQYDNVSFIHDDILSLQGIVFGMLGGVVVLTLLILAFIDLYSLPKLIINPEYAALERILTLVNNLK